MRILAPAFLAVLTLPALAQDQGTLRERMSAARGKVFPCLVHIVNVEEVFRGGEKRKEVTSGSGFFIDANGHVVTNFHVAGTAKLLHVTLPSKRRVRAKLVAGDAYTDLAVLKVDPKLAFPDGKAHFVSFGDAAKLREGDFVMAMGSPLSLSRSVSFGIISCRDRILGTSLRVAGHETGKYNTWLQTDAAINPGNSGGPLVNLAGEVIGVNTRANLMANNIGFAIPADVVQEVVQALLEHRTVPRSYLGLKLQPLGELEDTMLGAVREGVLVAGVEPNTAAARAGIQPGDFVTQLNGKAFGARFDEQLPGLYRRISQLPLGKAASLAILRRGRPMQVQATPTRLGAHLGKERQIASWGITVRAITDRMKRDLGLPDVAGVQVTGVRAGSPASGRLEARDVLRTVQGTKIESLETFLRLAMASVKRKDALVRLTLIPAGTTTVLDVKALKPTYAESEKR